MPNLFDTLPHNLFQSLSLLAALSDSAELIDVMLTLNRKLEQDALSADLDRII